MIDPEPRVESAPVASRERWRRYPLDGAVLWFHPASGVHVRYDGPSTRALRRVAPRTVMFGITNRCNLSCPFCSRDRADVSDWGVESAFGMLSGLARRGVQEVAFGGGEPLVFRGFERLVDRLAAETALAVHFTTNGTLLTRKLLLRLRGVVGQIRLSLYDDQPWEDRVAMLMASGTSCGVNLLVTPSRLPGLMGRLHRLRELGCRDVALLSYVGPDARLRLTGDEDRRLAAAIAESPLPTRLSVCFGGRLDQVPRLFAGVDGDCGAGSEFVVLTSDRRMKACSFHAGGWPVETAADVLRHWNRHRHHLLSPAGQGGCARPATATAPLSDGFRVWRAFASNNSGDCVLVGRFDKVEDAEKYISDLLPGFSPHSSDSGFPESWRRLLAQEGIRVPDESYCPDTMVAIGHSVLLHTEMALEDEFPALRELVTKRGGVQVYNGVHVHDTVSLLCGLRFATADAVETAEAAAFVEELGTFVRRGLDLYGLFVADHDLDTAVARLRQIARVADAILAAELVEHTARDDLAEALDRCFAPGDFLGARDRRTRLEVRFGIRRLWLPFRRRTRRDLLLTEIRDSLRRVLHPADHVEVSTLPGAFGGIVQTERAVEAERALAQLARDHRLSLRVSRRMRAGALTHALERITNDLQEARPRSAPQS